MGNGQIPEPFEYDGYDCSLLLIGRNYDAQKVSGCGFHFSKNIILSLKKAKRNMVVVAKT